jgi:hypothetical protein
MDSEENVKSPKNKEKDIWDKMHIVLGPVGGLLTAFSIAAVSYYASDYLNKNQENEAKTRLYTELMSRREESESALRKDMFTSILSTILKDESSLDERILQLELLAYNFHESLNLMPLFSYLDRRNNLDTKDPVLRSGYRERLYTMSREVTNKQIASLESVSTMERFVYCYDTMNCAGASDTYSCTFYDSIYEGGHYDSIQHIVHLTIQEMDSVNFSVNVSLKVCTRIGDNQDKCAQPVFDVDFFEFPMIDNTRLVNDKRISVVMRDYDPANKFIELDLIFFPGSHSSLKERPYYDDIVSKLLPDR